MTDFLDRQAGDYVVPNVLSPRDLVSRPDNMNETVLHTTIASKMSEPINSNIRERICEKYLRRSAASVNK